MVTNMEQKDIKEYEDFLKKHYKGHYAQSEAWANIKSDWKNEIIIVRDENNKIKGTMSVLIRKLPYFKSTLMYAPRGPVCDIDDKETFNKIMEEANKLAKKYKSFMIKADPDVLASNEEYKEIAKKNGLSIPIVYNTNSYENVETIKMLEGLVDVYLPDFKYFDNEIAQNLSQVKNYSDVAKKAIQEMYRQVGIPKFEYIYKITKSLIEKDSEKALENLWTRTQLEHQIATNLYSRQALLDNKIAQIQHIVDTYEHGKYIKNGVNVAILGKPNVGKSSLLNKLANYEKAIVTNIPGTTRDIVEETINLGNIVLNISDTAGIRDTDDIIEKIGVEKSLKILEEMDLVLYLINGQDGVSSEDFEILSKIQNKGLKYITVINKMDVTEKSILAANMDELVKKGIRKPICISVQENTGIEDLKNEIINLFDSSDLDYSHELIITNERHKDLLKKSIEYLKDAKNEISMGQPIDIVSIYVKKSTKTLGEIIGADVTQDIIAKIFEKFCLGK